MSNPRFLVVKHVPDLHRFEPRNIGVIVWAQCGVAARFLAETSKRGEVDGRSVPTFIASPRAYKQWVYYWRSKISSGVIQPVRGGPPVHKDSPRFVDALIDTGAGDFLVSDGGIVLEEVNAENIDSVADDIYARLVLPHSRAEQSDSSGDTSRDKSLNKICDELLRESNITLDPNFKTDLEVTCQIDRYGQLVERFEFSHGYKNGSIQRLYQRVPLPKSKRLLKKAIHHSAWMFEKVAADRIVAAEQCASLVYANEDRQREPDVASAIRVLSSVSRVVNVNDRDAALDEFKGLARLSH